MSTVQIKLGDLFDSPADMVVLPCNVQGGVSRFVLSALRRYAIPDPPPMRLGEIRVIPMNGAENVAQFAAYAASVLDGVTTTERIVEDIGRAIGEFCKENREVSNVSAPLLGAGAGGLQSEKVVLSLKNGFTSIAPAGCSLTINVRHDDVHARVRHNIEEARRTGVEISSDIPYKRVFISYSGGRQEHEKWILEVATLLRKKGIDARLDKWHLRHGMELPQWMVNELEIADKVLIISDESYKEKAEGHVGGVGWETRIIQGDMLNLPPENTKYIVVVRGEDFSSSVPSYLKAKFAIHWPPQAPAGQK